MSRRTGAAWVRRGSCRAHPVAWQVRAQSKLPASAAKPRAAEFTAPKLMGTLTPPFIAVERGYSDDVIMPQATRPRIARALAMLRGEDGGDAGAQAR